MSENTPQKAIVALSADPWTHGHSKMVELAQMQHKFSELVI